MTEELPDNSEGRTRLMSANDWPEDGDGRPQEAKMPDLIEPLIGPVTSMHPETLMQNKTLEGGVPQARFLQYGMPQLRLDQNRMSNPEIQKIMHTLRKDAKHKPNIAERRRARMLKKGQEVHERTAYVDTNGTLLNADGTPLTAGSIANGQTLVVTYAGT
jgi:hypothetical protein